MLLSQWNILVKSINIIFAVKSATGSITVIILTNTNNLTERQLNINVLAQGKVRPGQESGEMFCLGFES